MVKFGSTTFPRVQGVQKLRPRIQQQIALPGRNWSYRRDRGGFGLRFTLKGLVYIANPVTEDALEALADGTARILDLQEVDLTVLERAFHYATGPSWTDNTTESQSAGGTPFTLLGASTDYAYFGHREKFNQVQFDLQTLGSYGTRTWEYSDGAGAWKTLTVDSDGTSGFTQDGTVIFTPPSDWKQDTVNSVGSKFWIRVKVASVTTAATVNQIQVNLVYLCIMVDPVFDKLNAGLDETPYSCLFLQQENPS